MEIRNNTPSFGMALKKPTKLFKISDIQAPIIKENEEKAMSHFEHTIYDGLKPKLMTRALRQYKGHQQNNMNYHIEYIGDSANANVYKVRVINSKTGEVVKSYDQNTKFKSETDLKIDELKMKALRTESKFKKNLYALRGIYLIVKESISSLTVKPEKLMPAPFKAAAKTADELNKAALQQENNIKTVSKIFNEG